MSEGHSSSSSEQRKHNIYHFGEGDNNNRCKQKISLALVAEETAAVDFQLWGDKCDAFDTGNIVQLSNGIFSYTNGNLVLRAGKRGKAQKIGEFTMAYVETPNISEICWVLDPNDPRRYVQKGFDPP